MGETLRGRPRPDSRIASSIFIDPVRVLLESYREAETIVTFDNHIIYKNRVTRAWLAEFGDRLRLHLLPSCCPNENRIERIWLDPHADITRNH